ncbi:MAG: flagellar motor switch protein FliN [Bdellovibrionales bacterium]|nr:flagellar motor switch protein FliN [Bdellovibrionales bacterium]
MADNDLEKEIEEVALAAEEVVDAATEAQKGSLPRPSNSGTLDMIMDVTLQVTVEVGRARMTIQDLLQLGQGSIMELQKLAGEPLDIYVNGKPVAHGEAVIVNEKFGVRIQDIITLKDRIEGLA